MGRHPANRARRVVRALGVRMAAMFDPMFGAGLLELVPWAIGLILALAGFYWIHRIIKDIEDN